MDLTALFGGILLIALLLLSGAFPDRALHLARWTHLFNPARSRGAVVAAVLAVTAPFIFTACQIAIKGVPSATVHDEFSYLLAADTFVHGRLANPVHPMWKFFESFHILQHPSYASKYPPASGAALAAGAVLLGHPWFGVFASVAAMSAASYWALLGWAPRRWALLGCLLVSACYGVNHYWITSYWGGAMAGLGGALYFGALGRICYPRPGRAAGAGQGVILGAGLALLANTRPWEGMLIALPGAALMARHWFASRASDAPLRATVVASTALVLAATAGGMAVLNQAVTGDWARLPYAEYSAQYESEPLFLAGDTASRTVPYRHEVMRLFYSSLETYQSVRKPDGSVDWERVISLRLLVLSMFFGASLTSVALLLVAPMIWRNPKQRFALVSTAFFFAGFCLQRYHHLHYLAPALAVLAYLKVSVIRDVLHLASSKWPPAPAFAYGLMAIELVNALFIAGAPYEMHWDTDRDRVARELESKPGPDLAIVRYSAGHDPRQEWVYNAADIDAADIVWAREMEAAETCELVSYFSDRNAWLVEPDKSPVRPEPYIGNCGPPSLTSALREGSRK